VATVLIIEDDEDMRDLQQTVLEGDGYKVITARDGLEGLRQLSQTRPCVILLDLMMPVMDGLAFLAERTKVPDRAAVPVVCVSAGSQQLLESAKRLGAVECLTKPADLDLICATVAKHCH
jgi:CheY-like chemotaxis protein